MPDRTSPAETRARIVMGMEPSLIMPMLALVAKTLPDNSAAQWAFEWKWDGFRAIVHATSRQVEIWSRNQISMNERFPSLLGLSRVLPPHTIIDGEVVALDAAGRPSFSAMQQRSHQSTTIVLMIFDLLYLRGKSLLARPYRERRARLEDLQLDSEHWKTPANALGPDAGAAIWAAANEMQFEGVVAKRLDSAYAPGARTGDWIKVKITKRDEFVVGGYLPGDKDPNVIGKLLLGYYGADGLLHYAGGVGTGFTNAERASVKQRLDRSQIASSPFTGVRLERDAVFSRPQLIAEVAYSEWTHDARIRHPSFKGFRRDKKPREVLDPRPAPSRT